MRVISDLILDRRMNVRNVVLLAMVVAMVVVALLYLTVGEAAPPNFVNEILVTNITEPITMQFLPDGRMLVVGRLGTIWVVQQGATQIDPIPFLQLTNISNNSSENGVFSIVLDPNFAQNQAYYLFYTCASPLLDRVSRFVANGSTTSLATEQVIWQDTAVPGVTHHGGSMGFGPDGKLYVSVGENFIPNLAQQLDTFRGKILRMNSDGTAPTDNPFYQGLNQPRDYIWALGLRNPFRMSFDRVTGRLYIADVGGNNQATAQEEVNIGAPGANYGWPNCEGPCGDPNVTDPLFFYSHNNVHAAITGGFVYRGSQFPSQYVGSYFYGDFERNFIKGVSLNAAGQVTGTFNFEPANGASDGPFGNITYLTEGPDGALYYVDYNYDASGIATSPGSIRRIRYTLGNSPPNVVATANPTSGTPPLNVSFSSAGTIDPENNPLTYSWDFGDGATSTLANPAHTYQSIGLFTARLTVSDGPNQVLSNPINITVGNAPAVTIGSPTNGVTFIARDVIAFSGSANDPDDGPIAPAGLTWHIVFHHGTHTHPIVGPITGISSGTYTIPTTGHDYSGQTSYEIILTATDSDGLQNSASVFIFPQKVNLTFNTVPSGLDIFLDGIKISTPLVLDTLIGFDHTLQAVDQIANGTQYTFLSWSDNGAQTHTVTTPNTSQTYTATYAASAPAALLRTSLDDLAAVQNPARGTGTGASVTTVPTNDFVPAQFGNGIRLDAGNEAVQFLQANGGGIQNVELDHGAVDFWYRPNSVHTDGLFHPLVSIGAWATAGSIHIMKQNAANSNGLGVQFRDASGAVAETDIPDTGYNFTPGTWVNIRATWDFNVAPGVRNIHMYMNGVEAPMVFVTTGPRTMPAESATRFIYIGNRGDASGFSGNGVFDELTIYPVAIVPSLQDLTPPVRSNGQPSGSLGSGTTSTNISLTTNEASMCRYSTSPGNAFASMTNLFTTTGGTAHSTVVAGLSDGGSYTYYVRCQDSAGNANVNDFNIAFSVSTATPTNLSPTANAGLDQAITLPASASLNGSASDDGLPNPPAILTTTWSKFSGPGTVTFGNANAVNTTASFSTAGTYVLRLTANDSALSSSDDVNITVNPSSSLPLLQTSLDNLTAVQSPAVGTGAGASVNTVPSNDFVAGQFGNGIRIDAANESAQFVQTSGGVQNVELDQGAVDFWYRPNSVHTDGIFHPLISIGPWATAGTIHIIKQNASNNNALGVQFRDASGAVAETDVPDTGYNFTPGTWVNIRATWDFKVAAGVRNIHMYVNGVEAPMIFVSTGPRTMPAESATRFIYMGNRGDSSGLFGNGVFDEVTIYPVALAPGQQDVTPPARSNGQPSGIQPSGATSTNISLQTNEAAVCRYATTPGTAFAAMPNVFTTTGGTSHSTLVSGLSDGGSYTYSVRCQDGAGNANTNDFNIAFTVATATPTNQAPTVNAGVDQIITLPASAGLNGSATDDGLPSPPATLTTTWSKFSGPGTVTFGNASALNTTAGFSLSGMYVLRLTANDSALSSSDDLTIMVNPTTPVNQAPTVNAGLDQTITLPANASVNGTASDDGLPSPPGTLTTTWSQFSGPGTASFTNANALITTVSFSASGTYVLRLTANDSALSSIDDVTIIVNPVSAGGALSGSLATPSGPVNLSTVGILDWAHWGLIDTSSFNHKSGVAQQISNFTPIGSSGVNRYQKDPNTYSWTGGTPTASALNSPNGVWTLGAGNGFQITLPANTTNKTLKLYVGAWAAQGRLEASLSDGSAPVYLNTSVLHTGSGANTQGVYTINFNAASNGQTLTIRWTVLSSSAPFGNVTLQAATLF